MPDNFLQLAGECFMAFSSSEYEGQRKASSTLRFPSFSKLGAPLATVSNAILRQLEMPAQKLLLRLKPEFAHSLTINWLAFSQKLFPKISQSDDEVLAQKVFGLTFKNPIGVAAGLDKDAQAVSSLLGYGFGFVEIGTVTPRPQYGNLKPRVFRLSKDDAIINHFGFNSHGMEVVYPRLARRVAEGGIVGVNIGANKDSIDRVADYVELVRKFASLASYFTINISSPNTPGLRDLQQARALDGLLARVLDEVAKAGRKPVLLKIAPDLSLADLDEVVGIARKHRLDGMIVGNTTIARPGSLRERDKAKEAGGLSGRPLFRLATRMLAETFVRAEGAFPLIGVGGIDSGPTAIAKIKAGATLLQLYTGLVFRGIGVVAEIKADLLAALKRGHRNSLSAMVGVDAADITAESWPG